MSELETEEIEIRAIPDDALKSNSEGVLTLFGRPWDPDLRTDLDKFNQAWDRSLALHVKKVKRVTRR